VNFIENTGTPDYCRGAKIFEIVFAIKHIGRYLRVLLAARIAIEKEKKPTPPHNNCVSTHWFMCYCKMSKIVYIILYTHNIIMGLNGVFDLAKQTFVVVVYPLQLPQFLFEVVHFLIICYYTAAPLHRDYTSLQTF